VRQVEGHRASSSDNLWVEVGEGAETHARGHAVIHDALGVGVDARSRGVGHVLNVDAPELSTRGHGIFRQRKFQG
jgi:hypothetical protein